MVYLGVVWRDAGFRRYGGFELRSAHLSELRDEMVAVASLVVSWGPFDLGRHGFRVVIGHRNREEEAGHARVVNGRYLWVDEGPSARSHICFMDINNIRSFLLCVAL